jgi:hypothetical protein
LFFDILNINLIYRVSDKRLLERCGIGKGYLNETQSGSVRPSGLRIKRAEARTKGTWSQTNPGCSVSRRKPETFFQRLSHRASEKQRASAPSLLKLAPFPPGSAHRSLKDTSSWNAAARWTKGQLEGAAINSRTGKPRVAVTDRKT